MSIAIIQTGGKQYKVKKGEIIEVEKILGEENQEIIFDKVLFFSSEEGKEIEIGKPFFEDRKVIGKILKQKKGKKVFVLKYKAKTRYRKKKGHRQLLTQVLIKEIV